MTQQELRCIFYDNDSLWSDEWDEQEWVRSLRAFKNYPQWAWRSHYWNESAEIIYWEPLYHPINAFKEVKKTLYRMRILFFRRYEKFAQKCFKIESKIGW